MLTYQLQHRVLKKTNDKDIVFPNDVEIEIGLEPTGQFGIGSEMGKTIVKGSPCTPIFDMNTGKSWIKSNTFLKPIDATIEWTDLKLELKGNRFYVKSKCDTCKNLTDLLIAVHYGIPILLNLEFAEPPIVKYTRGRIGDATFNWELEEKSHWFDITNDEKQEKRVIDSFQRMTWILQLANRRLAAAAYYFYLARRLVESGNSPFEFMAEVVLNLCKTLEALFGGGGNCDKVRNELQKLGYSNEEIEEKFIPIMILRNNFDVGHPSLRLLKQRQLNALHRYLEISERTFRDLLRKVIEKVEKREYLLESDPDLSLKGKKLKRMEDLILNFEKARDPRRFKL